MSAKRAFFSIFQKIMVVCCAIFFGFANAFSANLPSGYTELEYIESTGTQWINTGVELSFADINFDIKFEFVSTQGTQGIFGYLDNSISTTNFYFTKSSTNTKFIFASGTSAQNISYSVQSATPYTIVLNDSNLKINGTSFNVSRGNLSSGNEIYLFNRNNSQSLFVGKIYYFKIYNNDTLLRDFVPAKNSSGVVGMYDTVNDVFYTNQGTDEFTGGPVVCPNGELAQTYTSATGNVTQSVSPTPTNPIEPTFYQQGNIVLRALKSSQGDINYKDSYDATTGKITRRVGMRILDGTENWSITTASVAENSYFYLSFNISLPEGFSNGAISTHFPTTSVGTASNNQGINVTRRAATGYQGIYLRWNDLYVASSTTLNSFKQWLAQQYAAGTPVTVYYPLVTPVEETVETTYCANPIKIATTAYNAARFSPVVNDLNSTVATIRDIVTNTINQTAAIASLQADKQTRPEDACPAGKKCLLVETEENGVIVPHWYPIIESADD